MGVAMETTAAANRKRTTVVRQQSAAQVSEVVSEVISTDASTADRQRRQTEHTLRAAPLTSAVPSQPSEMTAAANRKRTTVVRQQSAAQFSEVATLSTGLRRT